MDEYLGMPMTHTASFRRFLKERVVNKTHPKTVHYLEGDSLEPIAECDRYSLRLRDNPIDLCCCGIGENGHLAFNDPPVADFQDPRLVKIVKLDDASRRQQVGEGFYPDLSQVPQYAMTLTVPALLMAETVLCIVPESRKAVAVKAALEGPIEISCPASFLRKQRHATLFLDSESSALIRSE
jgi:glucosamine-6-phosphate deaminase